MVHYYSILLATALATTIYQLGTVHGAPTPAEECSFLPHRDLGQCESFWGNNTPPVILVSLDGFRPEYLTRPRIGVGSTMLAAPTLTCLAREGVTTPYMMPSYPTITFPNHYSIVTGLYPESHQVISNDFFDPDLNATFSLRDPNATDPKWWRSGEPLWTTVRSQGKLSATYFWPGSDVVFPAGEERAPNYYYKYNKSVSFHARVNQVLEWMDLPIEKRPAFVTLYFEEPDATGHKAGPDTSNVTEKVLLVDDQIRRLVDGLTRRNNFHCVNLIIVSDHGMADSFPSKQIVDLQTYLPDLDQIAKVFYGPVTSIRPNNDTREEENRLASALACKDEHMRVYNKWELPYRMHSAHSRRIPKLMLDLDLSWRGIFKKDPYSNRGAHGWDNLYQEMQAVFVAHGPSFKSNLVARPFENVELYNLVCALVNVTPAANNGTWGALHHLLVDPPSEFGEDNTTLEMPNILRTNETEEVMSEIRCKERFNRTEIPVEQRFYANISEERENELLVVHAPQGIPIHTSNTREAYNASLIVNEDYIIGLDEELGQPFWAAYTVTNSSNRAVREDGNSWIVDPRLESSNYTRRCQQLKDEENREIYFHQIFPAEFATRREDAWLETNMLALPLHMTSLVKTMMHLLAEAVAVHGEINVISGPTRHHSPALFYVVTACIERNDTAEFNQTKCPVEKLELQAFLLPLRQRLNQACVVNEDFIAFNVATLKDVERVTDLRFFSSLSLKDKRSLLIRTTLDSKLVVNPARS